ncbi:penicillin-binding protein [Fluviicola taffensis]|uniref:Peptidoglycan glycosyltransferase n=1 Tax=Fluviicola taffensis (strain DSM 16823 / NCIMB 13979 / RW262) TaxID=755732 RepID=F2IAN9_FLUTR|nr:penicillin-binding protein [Fluviicola taffensis]AEA44194.1 Peptidoglycan glycosyltransferase [Fluviicola taffensis DSM 16823]
MSDKKDLMWRAYLVYIGFFIALIVVIVKTIMIQTEGSTSLFAATEEKIPTRSVERYPRRGEVLDRNYTPLITSVSFFDIHMDPTVVDQEIFDKEIGALSIGLSKLFPETSARDFENYIRKGRARGRRYITIKLKATNEQKHRLAELPIFNLGRNKGGLIDTDETILRKRPHGEILKRTLGYYQHNENSKELRVGIEGAFNEVLAGEPGKEIEQRISSGWKKTGKMIREPIEGADLITSIDMDIQEVAHTELYRQLKNQNAKSGCVIVMDVKTGFVRAISNLQLASDGEYYELYNHAIGTKEVPGSTFKLASLMAALEDKKISLDDTVNAVGKYQFYDLELDDSNPYGYGRITIRRAFELSSNVIARVINNAYRKEPQLFIDRLRTFGIGDSLGIDLQGESKPTLYSPGTKQWSGVSLPIMSIGYEIQQTPLQTLAFYNAVANNGTLVRPQFVEHIRRGQRIVKSYKPVVLRPKICSDKTLRLMQECLKGVVKRGTGSALKSSLFDIAGKTGTAVVQNADGRYGEDGNKTYQASFVGYFPADEPLYSCIVVVAAPSKDIYGATVSGTVFSAIANKVYSNSLNYHKAINEEKNRIKDAPSIKDGNISDLLTVLKGLHLPYQLDAYSEWSRVRTSGSNISIVPRKISSTTVPNVIGLTAKDAVWLIEHLKMHVYVRGSGKVVKQTISAGSPIVPGGLIELVLE